MTLRLRCRSVHDHCRRMTEPRQGGRRRRGSRGRSRSASHVARRGSWGDSPSGRGRGWGILLLLWLLLLLLLLLLLRVGGGVGIGRRMTWWTARGLCGCGGGGSQGRRHGVRLAYRGRFSRYSSSISLVLGNADWAVCFLVGMNFFVIEKKSWFEATGCERNQLQQLLGQHSQS